MKWHNLNLSIRLKISSGAAWLTSIGTFLAYSAMSIWVPAIHDNYLAGCGALVGLLGIYLKQQDSSNKLDVAAAKDNLGERLGRIKAAAVGNSIPCPPEEEKRGDPLS